MKTVEIKTLISLPGISRRITYHYCLLFTCFTLFDFILHSVNGALLSSCYFQTNVSSLPTDFSPRSCVSSHLPSYLQHTSSSSSSSSSSSLSSSFPVKKNPTSKSSSTSMRAWTCHGRSHREMIDRLASAGIIQHPFVKEAMLRVDRANYVLHPEYAYMDAPQLIGSGQTISAPHMHGHALEEMVPALIRISKELPNNAGLQILDVGCGSGYLTAALGRLVDGGMTTTNSNTPFSIFGKTSSTQSIARGKVYGIDVYPQLVDWARENLKKADQDLLTSGTVTLQVGDGWRGLPDHAPFHAIHVGAAAETLPMNLMMQLYPNGGIMIVPIGPEGGYQSLYRVERIRDSDTFDERDFRIRSLLGVRYVPLIHP